MRRMKPQKQLLQFVMLALLSVVSVLVMANESFAALQCYSCHGVGTDIRPIDTPNGSPNSYRNITTGAVKGNHSEHVAATATAADCARCHYNQATSTSPTAYNSSHRNGTINFQANINNSPSPGKYKGGVAFVNQTSVPTLGTCATTNCHFETPTPTWGADPAATNCDTCHASVPGSGSHTKHTTKYGGAASCTKCHAPRLTFQHASSAGNAGRTIDLTNLNAGTTYTGSNFQFLPSQSGGRALGTCNTNYCHSSGQSANGTSITPAFYAAPKWGTSTTTCTSCHDVAGATPTGTHVNHIAKDGNCGNCHTGATATTYASANHVDGFINVSGNLNVKYSQGRSSARGLGYGTCNNASCHAAFTNVTPNTAPTWGVTSAGCSYCHQGNPNTGAHTKHLSIAVVAGLPQSCDYCHTAVLTVSTATHIDGSVNVLQMAAPVAKHVSGAAGYTATCTTTCHTPFTNAGLGVTPNWGVSNANNCALCHEVSPTTGVHQRHLANTALITDCSTCHAGAIANSNGGTGHMDGNIDVIQYPVPGSVAKHASGNTNYSATCTTTCHNPTSTTVAIVTPNWGITTPSCADCHNAASGDTFDATGGPITGSHSGHMSHTNPALMSCAKCHIGAVAGSNGGTKHLSGFVNVSSAGTGKAAVAKHASGGGYMSCTATCHNGVAFTAPVLTWGATLDCSKCHGYPPAGPSHASVNPLIAGACNSCHSEVATTTIQSTPIGSAFLAPQLHMNGVTDGGRCDACHGYPPVQSMLGKGVNINYSSAKLENYSGGGGAHSVAGHVALTLKSSQNLAFGGGCSTCHPSTLHNQGAGTFLTANVQVTVDPQFKFNKNLPIVYNRVAGTKSTGTCSNVACHFKPSPIWSTGTYTQGH